MGNRKAAYDSLTRLRDRKTFFEDVREYQATGGQAHIIMVQLTRLINVNRQYGVGAGDGLLKEIAGYLAQAHPDYRAYRIANSRFMLLGPQCSQRQAEGMAALLHKRFEQDWRVVHDEGSCEAKAKAHLVHFFAQPGDSANDLLDKMNYAMTVFPVRGRSGVLFFDGEMCDALTHKQYVMGEVRFAVEQKTFQMYYQPIIDCRENGFVSAESLIRLVGRDGTFISPNEFIPMAEESGLIDDISWIVLEKVCEFLGEHPALPIKTISVNMTGQQVLNPVFEERISENLERYHVAGERLRIEITERTVTENFDKVKQVMERLGEKGIRFYLDDFGTGYSNLSSMLSLPFEVIKFDQSLMRIMMESEKGLLTIDLLAQIMHVNDYIIVAEGIETRQQDMAARERKLDRIQGYYYSRPLPGGELIRFLEQEARRE